MKKKKRMIEDDNMLILGNCEVVGENNTIYLKRSKKKNLFEGNLPDNIWTIDKAYIYKIHW